MVNTFHLFILIISFFDPSKQARGLGPHALLLVFTSWNYELEV